MARYLTNALQQAGFKTKVFARQPRQADELGLETFEGHGDLQLICVSDDQIEALVRELPLKEGILAHVSGSVSMRTLQNHYGRAAVFYPLMSVAQNETWPISEVPFCLEAAGQQDYQALLALVKSLGAKAYPVNGAQRPYLHLAAVWAQNFGNYLLDISHRITEDEEIDPLILKPLMQKTVSALSEKRPISRQSGPAIRGDEKTMQRHLAMLNRADWQDLYSALSQAVQKDYHDQL